jgi:hypothetical protein
MGLMDRILTAIPDSDWRQAAHERRSPSYGADAEEFFRRPRERDAAPAREPFDQPQGRAEPASLRPSWHERFMPGDEYADQGEAPMRESHHTLEEPAGQDDYECGGERLPQDERESYEREPCELGAPEAEPELEPAAAHGLEYVEAGDVFAGAGISPVESEPHYTPELYPLGDGMAIDSDGFLTDADGRYLKGMPLDAATGGRRSDIPSFVCVEHHFLPAKASREVRYQVNLPAYPMTAASDPQQPGSELLDVQSFNRSPAANGFGLVTADDAPRFMSQSMSGGSVTLFDQTGSAVQMRLRWAKIASSNNGGDRWNLFYLAWSDAVGREASWRNVGVDYTFNAEGRLDPALPRVTLTGVMIDGLRCGDVTLAHGRDGVTQFAGRHGVVKVRTLAQDGHVAGDFVGLDVSDMGLISARYSNGRVTPLAENVFTSSDVPMAPDPMMADPAEALRAVARLMGEMAYEEAA